MKINLRFAPVALALSVAAALLFGCSKDIVGEGQKPTRMYLGVSTEEEATQMAECTSAQMNAYVVFDGDNGESIGTYNDRAQWSSDNPSVVLVSDGVTASPDGTVYTVGTIVGLRPGVATISASYLDFHAAITVDVSEMSGLRIDSDLTDIGAQLDQAFVLKAVLSEGSPEQDITTSAAWRFDPATSQAYVDSATGLVHANSETGGQNLRLVARLPECDREVSTSFRVSPVQALQIDYERGADVVALPEGFSESFTVYASFADTSAPRQNVTTQMTVDEIDDDYIAATLGEDAYYVTADDRVGSGRLELSLDPLDLKITTKSWQVQDSTLIDLQLTPDDLRITYPDTGQLIATGTFDNGLVMPVTRHVSFTSADAEVLTVGGGNDTAGEVTTTNTDANVEVSASIAVDDDTYEDSVTVRSYANRYAN